MYAILDDMLYPLSNLQHLDIQHGLWPTKRAMTWDGIITDVTHHLTYFNGSVSVMHHDQLTVQQVRNHHAMPCIRV